MWYIHTMEYYLAIKNKNKRDKVLSSAFKKNEKKT